MKLWSLVLRSLLPILAHAAPQTWTISNGEVQRTITFSEYAGLTTEKLSDLRTRADYIPQPHPSHNVQDEFSFQCNGHHEKAPEGTAGRKVALGRLADTARPEKPHPARELQAEMWRGCFSASPSELDAVIGPLSHPVPD